MSTLHGFLKHKLVILSGASSGIGRSLAALLIRRYGCRVIGLGRNEARLREFADSLGEDGAFFSYRLLDVTQESQWRALREELTANGVVPDLLINNAGVLPRFCAFSGQTREEIDRTMATNFTACVTSTQLFLPLLCASPEGGVVNISSADALAALAGTGIYSASKAAAKAFTEALREELRGRLYVGLVCPGFTRTALFAEQKTEGRSGIVYRFATDPDAMARRIARGIDRRRGRMVLGTDARLMDAFSRLMPSASLRLFAKFIRLSRLELFEDVFPKK